MNPKMSKHAFTKNFKVVNTPKGYKAKPKKWVLERGRKVTWKRQRAQDARSKMLDRIPEDTTDTPKDTPEKA